MHNSNENTLGTDQETDITRRRLLLAALGAAVTPLAFSQDAQMKKETMSHHVSAPAISVPANTCDCHVHVFDPTFPYAAHRTYTPGRASVEDLQRFEATLGVERVVLVQPSVYGTDNRCLLDALGKLGKGRARGIAVVDLQAVTDEGLRQMHKAGVRGMRLNLEVKGEHRADAALASLRQAEKRLAPLGWSVQIYADLPLIIQLADALSSLKIPVMLDHYGGVKTSMAQQGTGIQTLRQLCATGNVHVKMSAPYRVSTAPDYADVEPIAKALIGSDAKGLVWASDWPHTGSSGKRSGNLDQIEPFRSEDDGKDLDLLSRWIGDQRLRQKILVDNAARFYDF